MTSPVRPSRTPKRRSLSELNAEIDSLLSGVELEDPQAPAPRATPAPAPRRSLLDGFTPPKSRVVSDATDRMGTNDPRRRATFDYTNAPDANTLFERGREKQRGEPGVGDFLPNLATGAASSATGIAAGALRLPGKAVRGAAALAERVTGSPRETNYNDQNGLERAADGLETASRGLNEMVPVRSGYGLAGRMLGGAAPYMLASGARAATEIAVGGGLTALESIGNSSSSATGALGEWEKMRRKDGAEESWFDPALRAAGRIAESDAARPVVDAAVDMGLGYLIPKGAKAAGRQLDKLNAPRAAAQTPFTPAPTLDATRPRWVLGGDGGKQPEIVEPDLDAWRETTFGSATFDDPLRAAQDNLDTETTTLEAARKSRIEQMRARGRDAQADRALQKEQREVAALQTQTPQAPRETLFTSDYLDAAARSQEAWARREYGQRDRLNAAAETGSDDEIINELNRLVKPRSTPLTDIRSKLDPQQATPQLDEVGQQLDEAGREALDAQNAPEVVNPTVRAAKAKLDEALDSGDDSKVSRALRDLAKLQDQGLYAAAPAGLALSQDENGEGMDGGDASLLALAGIMATRKGRKAAKALGEVAWENGKRVIRSLPDIETGEYQVAREAARARSQELLLDTPRFNAFGGKNLDDEIDELRARGETERADNMEKSFGQTVVRIPVFHATLADFTVPDPSKARADGFAGPTMYLTTNPSDAGVNYAKSDIYAEDGTIDYNKLDFDLRRKNKTGFGPDLNIRFDEEFDEAWSQKLAELRYSGEIKNMSTEQIDALRNDMAAAAARKVAHSDLPAGNIMPMYADVRKPFVTNGPNITLYDMDNWGAKEEQAFRKAAREAGAEPELIRESLADIRATMEGGESLSHYYFANLTANLTAGFDFAKGADILQRFVKKLGYDAFVTDAAEQFPAMKLTPGTMHVQVFDPNSQVKSATGNTGAFDMNNPDIRYGAAGAAGAGAAASEDEDMRNTALGVAGMALGTSKVGRSGLRKAASAAGDFAQRFSKSNEVWSRASIELATMKDARFSGIENLPESEALELQIGAQRMVSEKVAKGLGLKEGRDFRASPSHGLWFSENGDAPVQPSLLLEFSPKVDKAKALAFVAEQSRIMKQAGMFYMDVSDAGNRQALDFVVRDADGEVMHAAQYLDLIKEGRAGWNGATVLDDGNRVMIVMDEGVDEAATVAEFDRFEQIVEQAGFTLDREESLRVRVNAEEVGEEGYAAIVERSGVRGQAWRESVREAERLYEGVAVTAEKRVAAQRIKERPDAQALTLNLDPESLAAVRVGSKTYVGRDHASAFGKAQQDVKKGKVSQKALDAARADTAGRQGYTLDNGEFVSRFEGEAVLELMEERGDDLASRALGKIQEREASGATSWLKSEDFKGYRSALGPAAMGAAATALAPSDAEAQGTGVGEAAVGVGGMLGVALAGGAAGAIAMRGARRLAEGKVGGKVRALAPKDAVSGSGATAPYTSNLRQIQRAALKNPIREVSEVVPEEWFRLDKVAPDADKARIAEAVERLVVSEGLGVQGFAKDGTPKVNKPVISWDTYRAQMKAKGMDAEDLITTAKRRGLEPAEMLGVQSLIGENSVAIAALDRAIRDDGTPKEEKVRLATIMKGYQDQMDRLVVTRMTESSGYGRNLNSLKMTAMQTLDPGVWYTRARRMLDDELSTQDIVAIDGYIRAQDRVGLAKYVADMKRTSAGDLFSAMVKGGMLSGFKTHSTNFFSNIGMAAAEITKDAPAAVADRVLTGLVNYLDPDKKGARRTKDFDLAATLKASAEGARKGFQEAKKVIKGEPVDDPYSKWDANGEATFRTGNPKADLLLTTAVNLPFRALAASDRIFRQAAMSRSIAEQQRAIGTQAVTEDMSLNAIVDAEYATFQKETIIGKGAQGMKQWAYDAAKKGGPAAEFVTKAVLETTLPFTKTPAAVLSAGTEYSLGLIATTNDLLRLQDAARKGLKDPAQRAIVEKLQKRTADRLGRQVVGAAAITTGWLLAANGMLSVPVPFSEQKRRETEELFGNAPGGSLNVGNENPVSVDRLSPLGNLLVTGASLFEQTKDPNNGFVQDIATATFNMNRAMLDNAVMSGVKDLQRATSENDGALERYGSSRVTSLVPYSSLLRSVERVVDPAVRDAQTTGEKLRNMVPFASSALPVKLDALGNPMTGLSRGKALLNEVIPGTLGIDRSKTNAQAKLLRDVGATLGRPEFTRKSETLDDYRARASVVGEATRKELDRLQRLPSWNRMSDEEKRDKIDARIPAVRGRATQKYRRGLTVPAESLRPNVAGGGGGSSY